jgi:hypothetical protein
VFRKFLREETLGKPYRCEIIWWLALSFYVKAFRSPWILGDMDPDTAFVGLGFSLDPASPTGGHVLLGCSHIYSAEGLGLRYTLSKLDNSVMRQGNPYLSEDDARRVGDSVRQLFFENTTRLPRRVVLHKRTPFTRKEREGLLKGLGGIASVDMLEITVDPALRWIASRLKDDRFEPDGFPVRRGTTMLLDERKALLWVHGTTAAVNSHLSYYRTYAQDLRCDRRAE